MNLISNCWRTQECKALLHSAKNSFKAAFQFPDLGWEILIDVTITIEVYLITFGI